jgi:hypothetical protein
VLVNVGFDGPLRNLIRRWDGALGTCLGVATYQSMVVRRQVPAATYVFSDLDRVPPGDMPGVLALWDGLSASGAAHLVNDPRRVRLRYPLLRRLFERGINDFNVHRADDDLGSVRFPAFVRCEHDHGGPRTGLLTSRRELDDALRSLRTRRAWRSQLLVTECAADPGADGLFRKYGALFVGGRVVPWHVIAGRTWVVKGASRVLNDPIREEQRRYIADNPHAERIREAFAIARIDYGRIDYATIGDRMRVYEINTNPSIGGAGRRRRRPDRRPKSDAAVTELIEAFVALADRCPAPGTLVPMRPRRGALPGWAYQGLRHGQSFLTRYAHRPGLR